MNRNRKLRKQMMSGLAVGMAAVMGAAPVYAATGEDAAVSKEETVYVNANADGSEDQITVSNWLKNAGTEKNLQDESELITGHASVSYDSYNTSGTSAAAFAD